MRHETGKRGLTQNGVHPFKAAASACETGSQIMRRGSFFCMVSEGASRGELCIHPSERSHGLAVDDSQRQLQTGCRPDVCTYIFRRRTTMATTQYTSITSILASCRKSTQRRWRPNLGLYFIFLSPRDKDQEAGHHQTGKFIKKHNRLVT